MINEVITELESDISKSHEALKRELTKIRTGRAHPSLLESVRVEIYGSQMPISQVATVSCPEARLLTVKPWDKTQLKAIEKAIVQTPLGLNPQSDGEILRIPMPPLTEERRKELAKLVKKDGEETKVAIRKARHDAKDMLESLEKDGQISQDDLGRAQKKVEDLIQKAVAEVDTIIARKDKDLLEV
jgi:ribosome recycling factor